jgi:hypothetical protein
LEEKIAEHVICVEARISELEGLVKKSSEPSIGEKECEVARLRVDVGYKGSELDAALDRISELENLAKESGDGKIELEAARAKILELEAKGSELDLQKERKARLLEMEAGFWSRILELEAK